MLQPFPSAGAERELEIIEATYKKPLAFVALVILAFLLYGAMTMPDTSGMTEEIADAQSLDADHHMQDITSIPKNGEGVQSKALSSFAN